jgi:flagellar hook-basal body complex protein FliE
MSVLPITLIDAAGGSDLGIQPATAGATPSSKSFADMLLDGVDATASRIGQSDRIVRQFVLDDSIPVHQVTYALEQARLSLELMVQVRTRLLEGYQQLMNMQL